MNETIVFLSKFHWNVGFNSKYICINLGNGLAFNKHQAMTWTNDNKILPYVASLGCNELITLQETIFSKISIKMFYACI